ncbi:hypothetical protein THRCLA_23267, partial [Thraustotheca clavata]
NNHHPKVVELLLNADAKANAEDYLEATPLHYAASNGHDKIVELLLYAGASVDSKDKECILFVVGWTPFDYVASRKQNIVVEFLLKAGAVMNRNFKIQ